MSFWCAAALMRVIQRRRNSRFFALRSRYAYFQPRSTFSFAGFHNLLRAPNAPRAAFMICFFRFKRGTFDRARGTVDLADVGEVIRDTIEHGLSELRVCDLPAAEHHRHLDFVLLLEESARVARLRLEVVIIDARSELHFLELDDVLLFLGDASLL